MVGAQRRLRTSVLRVRRVDSSRREESTDVIGRGRSKLSERASSAVVCEAKSNSDPAQEGCSELRGRSCLDVTVLWRELRERAHERGELRIALRASLCKQWLAATRRCCARKQCATPDVAKGRASNASKGEGACAKLTAEETSADSIYRAVAFLKLQISEKERARVCETESRRDPAHGFQRAA